ncbi:hypothetical protein ASE63_10215 [Bosea sp. Root381]|uniref:hypothetical protein n=1 Tax=Bosea sp. Root381 TaxID=1736524 RepID=UPI0006F5A562|nr:hypothetical protein [Bosea sp. Root381]KRD99885.1 hypothetical protein ASE63_10215 [Bosea sp. Root381]
MVRSEQREGAGERAAAASAMLLLQLAASQAEIGPFARRGRETPEMAARLYRAAALRARAGRSRVLVRGKP